MKRYTNGTYQRVAPKPETAKPEPAARLAAATVPAVVALDELSAAARTSCDALSRLGAVAESLRAKAREFDQLAAEVEEAAIAMEDRVTQASADGATLQQLKDLFAKISK